MSKKIYGELEIKIKELANDGFNANRIANIVGLTEGAISGWAKRNNIILQKRVSPETLAKEPVLIKAIQSGKILKHICQELNLDHRAAIKIIEKNNLSHLLRNRSDSSKDKTLTIEEANNRLPKNHGKVTHYDQNQGQYVILREDGTTYTRITSQIFRGDPNLSSHRRSSEEEISNKLLQINYKLISGTYVKKHAPLKAEHLECGYIRENVFYNFFKQKCPRCICNGNSKPETEIDLWIKSFEIRTFKFRFKKDCTGPGKGKEIDIYIPELKLGIEYCGLFHHGIVGRKRILDGKIKQNAERGKIYQPTDYDDPRLCHKIKMDKANEEGITLITIFGNEWEKSKEKVKSILKAKLNKNEIKIYARNTQLKEVNKKECSDFLNKYHLQGGTTFIIAFGLFCENELVAVITGNYHHRISNKFVLNRLCFKSNTTIIGGSSKLNKALENWARQNNITEIISWSDNRWSTGKVYKALGYSLNQELPPDYFYFESNNKVHSKQSCQKKNLIKKGAIGNTEWEMAQSLKYDRIWDCGKKAWIKKLI